jgi:predicted acetyltransferase
MATNSDRSAWVHMGDSEDLSFPRTDFDGYVAALRERETKVREGWVCDTTYWAVSGGEVIGRIAIRHELNDFLKKVGGHVGYIVRPSWRKRGVATEMLGQLLLTDRVRSLGRILLTCDEGNLASEKTIVSKANRRAYSL